MWCKGSFDLGTVQGDGATEEAGGFGQEAVLCPKWPEASLHIPPRRLVHLVRISPPKRSSRPRQVKRILLLVTMSFGIEAKSHKYLSLRVSASFNGSCQPPLGCSVLILRRYDPGRGPEKSALKELEKSLLPSGSLLLVGQLLISRVSGSGLWGLFSLVIGQGLGVCVSCHKV